MGPLEISDVSKDRATLSWKSPKDDGGNKVTGYIVERRDVSKGTDAWIPVTQTCKDTKFTVPSLIDGHEYEFRVMAINENGTSEPLCSSSPITAKLPFSMLITSEILTKMNYFASIDTFIEQPGTPGRPEVDEITNNTVSLHWDKPTSDGGKEKTFLFIFVTFFLFDFR